MNLFYLDDDLDLNASYHVDAHVGKMQLEATQLLTTALWIDREFGFVPRALTKEETGHLRAVACAEPPIDERTFTRYVPTHYNHPSNIWVRSSLDHYYWTFNYVHSLNTESIYRGRKPHASCAECTRLPEPTHLREVGFVQPTPSMPDEIKSGDIVQDYRLFYMLDKATFAKWTRRGKPEWWNEDIAMYERRYTDLSPAERRETGWLNG